MLVASLGSGGRKFLWGLMRSCISLIRSLLGGMLLAIVQISPCQGLLYQHIYELAHRDSHHGQETHSFNKGVWACQLHGVGYCQQGNLQTKLVFRCRESSVIHLPPPYCPQRMGNEYWLKMSAALQSWPVPPPGRPMGKPLMKCSS